MGRTGRSVEAMEEARRLYSLAQEAEDGPGMAECLTQIAWFCLQLGYADEGIDCAVAAKELWGQQGRTHGHANASAIYSWLLVEMGWWTRALPKRRRRCAWPRCNPTGACWPLP